MKWFWGFLRKYRFKLLGGLILTTFISVLAIVNPYVSGMIVDDVIQGGQYDLLWKLVLIREGSWWIWNGKTRYLRRS